MSTDCRITLNLKETQKDVFRVATDPMQIGLPLKVIASRAHIAYETLITYANGTAKMPVAALHKLCGVLPNELLSLLMPDGFAIVRTCDDADLAAMAEKCADFLSHYTAARSEKSEASTALGPTERDRLIEKMAELKS